MPIRVRGVWAVRVTLAYFRTTLFLVNMLMIESYISRYPEWEAYNARTGMLIPRVFFVRNRAEQPQVG
jgi:hypothetical protein